MSLVSTATSSLKELYALVSQTVIVEQLRQNNYPPEGLLEAAHLFVTAGRKVFAILV
jgi:hypothetical protein